jgi:hypothetical protein
MQDIRHHDGGVFYPGGFHRSVELSFRHHAEQYPIRSPLDTQTSGVTLMPFMTA